MAESNSYLPEDTLVLIMLRLPVKSLMRFRSVCKLWYQIITSASFIDAQRKTTKDQYLLCRHSYFCALISKEEFTNYRTYYFKPGVFAYSQEFINYKFYYYPSPELYGTGRNWYEGFKVCGSCNGLLCMVDDSSNSYSNIHLLNPVIRKVKTIPKITFELCPDDRFAALCFSNFDDDYKVIRLSTPSCRSIYRVGVYSLRTDCWKFTTFGSKHNTFHLQYYVPSICVGGVAYFPHSEGRIVCFDLHDERLSEVQLPAETLGRYFSWHCREISMQACGESIALMRIKDGFLEKWVLKNRYATDDHTWEAKTVTNIRTELASDYSMESSDVGAYMLRDTGRSCDLYLCGNPEITSQVDGFENYNLTQDLKVIDCHTANLLLLDEETLGPLFKEEEEETERSMLVLYSDVSREYYRRKYWPDKI